MKLEDSMKMKSSNDRSIQNGMKAKSIDIATSGKKVGYNPTLAGEPEAPKEVNITPAETDKTVGYF